MHSDLNRKKSSGFDKKIDKQILDTNKSLHSNHIEENNASQMMIFTKVYLDMPNEDIPNEETLQAMKDSRSGKNLTEYKNLKQLFNNCWK